MSAGILDRLASVARGIGIVSTLLVGGGIGVFALASILPRDIVHTTHGLIGFVLGIALFVGVVIANLTWWVISGRSAMDRLMDLP